jgi:predicted permease
MAGPNEFVSALFLLVVVLILTCIISLLWWIGCRFVFRRRVRGWELVIAALVAVGLLFGSVS